MFVRRDATNLRQNNTTNDKNDFCTLYRDLPISPLYVVGVCNRLNPEPRVEAALITWVLLLCLLCIRSVQPARGET